MSQSSNASDSEESNILDEIRDLENILATAPANPESLQKSSFEAIDDASPEAEVISKESSDSNESTSDHVTAAFNLNKQLIDELTNMKQEVSAILEDCNNKLQLIDQKIKQYAKNWTSNSRIMISTVGMPYFKDKDYFGAPKNDDAKLKIARGELQPINFRKACVWTARDRKILLNAVYDEVMVSVLENSTRKEKENTASSQDMFKKMLSARSMDEMIGSLGERKFDWLKIAAMNFDGRHSADECCVMWNVLLHPDINKGKWTRSEEFRLKKIAKLNGCKNWDKIAKQLNTRRSGYQCFVKYNCTGNILKLTERTWTAEEDERLCDVVAKCRIGDFIPWTKVMSYMYLRCKQQIYFRWMFRLAPHLKKGRFTKAESDTLLQGIDKFGTNFSLIAAQLMPDRTSVQLNDHYQTLISRDTARHWTLSSDMKLIDLYKKIGPDWSKIAKNFKYKNRTQVRHRYSSLFKYASKGLSIFDIPRHKNDNSVGLENPETSDEEYNIGGIKNDVNDKIDRLLIEHFQNLSTVESSQEENLYDPEELSKDTKELYCILESLQADLHIPDNFDYFPLKKRDKQLLYSLKAYMKLRLGRQHSSKEIETIRLKMFGPDSKEKQGDHFIPPLPFGVYQNLKNHKQTESIDYVIDINKKFLVDLETEFNTPDAIICLIGGLEEHTRFNKISNLHCVKSGTFLREKINLLPSGSTGEKSSVQSKNNPSKSLQRSIKDNNDLFCKRDTADYGSIGESSTWTTYLDREKESFGVSCPVIKPDYVTLSSYRHFFALKNIHDVEKTLKNQKDQEGVEKPYKLEKGYELLKKRLVQLFKYPIYMSHLSLREINDTMGLFSVESNNVSCKKRKVAEDDKFQSKKVKTNSSKIFIHDSNASTR